MKEIILRNDLSHLTSLGVWLSSRMISYFRFEVLLFFLLTLIAEILGTLGGFGSSMLFVPVSQFFFDFQTVLALTGILHVFSNISKVVLFRNAIDWKVTTWLGGASVLFVIAGAWLTKVVALQYAGLLLGIFLITFSAFIYFKPDFSIARTTKASLISGSLAGFLAGLIGTGGAIRGLALASFNLEKNVFVGTSALIDFGVDLSRTVIYLEADYLDQDRLIYIPILLVAAILGSYLGKGILQKIDQEKFRRLTLILIFLTGLTLISQYLLT